MEEITEKEGRTREMLSWRTFFSVRKAEERARSEDSMAGLGKNPWGREPQFPVLKPRGKLPGFR